MFYKFLHWIVTSVRVDWNHVFYNWKGLLSKEYTPLWECFSIFFLLDYLPLCELTTKVFLHLIMFLPKECTPLCKLTKMVFSTLKNVFYMRDIHLCASDFIYFLLKNYPCASWLKRCFLHLKLFSTRRIYTFCAIWLKCLFYT